MSDKNILEKLKIRQDKLDKVNAKIEKASAKVRVMEDIQSKLGRNSTNEDPVCPKCSSEITQNSKFNGVFLIKCSNADCDFEKVYSLEDLLGVWKLIKDIPEELSKTLK